MRDFVHGRFISLDIHTYTYTIDFCFNDTGSVINLTNAPIQIRTVMALNVRQIRVSRGAEAMVSLYTLLICVCPKTSTNR